MIKVKETNANSEDEEAKGGNEFMANVFKGKKPDLTKEKVENRGTISRFFGKDQGDKKRMIDEVDGGSGDKNIGSKRLRLDLSLN